MNRFIALLILSFAGSVASVFASRGIYFYMNDQYGWGEVPNLWVALGGGAMYVLGALPSHRLCVALGERNVMLLAIAVQIGCLALMCALPVPGVLVPAQLTFQFFNAVMWPVVESYVSAGRSPRETARALGRFNITWALATPIGVLFVGPIIKDYTFWLFGIGAGTFVLVGVLAALQPARISHLPHDHPERPSRERLEHCAKLLVSSRWLLLYAYALFYLVVPLTPQLFERLGYDVAEQTRLASVTEFVRWLTFLAMHFIPWWHDRAGVLWACALLFPVGMLLILLGPSAPVIVAGEIIFGIVYGTIYYAALYYVMVVKNASVDAVGAHESLIGLGYTIGPIAGLIGHALAGGPQWKFQFFPMLACIGPLVLVCTLGAAWPLITDWRTRRSASRC